MFLQLLSFLPHTARSHASNTRHMQDMKLVSLLLFRLHDDRLSRATIKSICNVINAILGSSPGHEDVQRLALCVCVCVCVCV